MAESNQQTPNLYEVLDISSQSSCQEVEAAFQREYNRWRRRIVGDNPQAVNEAKRRLRFLQQAYDILSDPHKRAAYDQYLTQQSTTPTKSRNEPHVRHCPFCGTSVTVHNRICKGCGSSLTLPCLSCQSPLSIFQAYCGKCGANKQQEIKRLIDEARRLHPLAKSKMRGKGGLIILSVLSIVVLVAITIVGVKWAFSGSGEVCASTMLMIALVFVVLIGLPGTIAILSQTFESYAVKHNQAVRDARERYQKTMVLLNQHAVRLVDLEVKESPFKELSDGSIPAVVITVLVTILCCVTSFYFNYHEAESPEPFIGSVLCFVVSLFFLWPVWVYMMVQKACEWYFEEY